MPEAKEPKTLEQLAKERVEAGLEADRIGAEAEQLHEQAVDLELDGKSEAARKMEAKAGDLRLKAASRERLAERLEAQMKEVEAQDLAALQERARESTAAMEAHREALALRLIESFFQLAKVLREWKLQIVQAAPPTPEELREPSRIGNALIPLLRSIAEDASGDFLRTLQVTEVDQGEYAKILAAVFPSGCSRKALHELGDKMRKLYDDERKFRLKAERTQPGELIDFAIRSARADAGLPSLPEAAPDSGVRPIEDLVDSGFNPHQPAYWIDPPRPVSAPEATQMAPMEPADGN